MIRIFHIFLHFLIPLIVAVTLFRREWKKALLIMVATMLVDIDHLLATPIYDPLRCSIGFHPLHQLPITAVYLLMLIPKKLRLVGLGLVIHMILDSIDCYKNLGIWFHG
ncbi:MAG: DUF6122 family protein [Psychrobium sp.]